MTFSILPPASTGVFETVVEAATDFTSEVSPGISETYGLKYRRPLNITVAPWLVDEYGLGALSRYFVSIEALIDAGRPWQRVRGTPAALISALGWIDYDTITIEDHVSGRRRWHLYQIGMGELPLPNESDRLFDAEYLAGLSDPARSFFWRGYHGYDVRGHVWGRSRIGRSIWGDSSGVRINGGKTKWSHGRTHPVSISGVISDWHTLGVDYIPGDDLSWPVTMDWSTPGISWAGVTDAGGLKSWLLRRMSAHVGFFDADGIAIGYARVVQRVEDMTGNAFDDGDEVILRYRVETAFGDGAGGAVVSVAIVFGLEPVSVKPFKKWVQPSQASFPSGEIRIGEAPLSFTFLRTMRERVVVTLTI